MEKGLTKQQLIGVLTKSPHGDLAQYAPIGLQAAAADPGFFAHLVAWNHRKGVIRDAKVALPVLALASAGTVEDDELRENALAHIASLDPRNLVRAIRFSKGQPLLQRRALYRMVERYLRDREASRGRFERVAMQHRASLKELYALLHVKPGQVAQEVLFAGAKQGVFGVIARLKDMAPDEAAGAIAKNRIPFLVAMGALGAKAKDPTVLQAIIAAMSPTELVTNAKMLDKLGVKTNPALRATFETALQGAAGSSAQVLKTTRAAEVVGGSTGEKLRGVQEKQLSKMTVEGNWLVCADVSASMAAAIDVARQVCALLARVAGGSVHLVFFNNSPTYHDVTGKAYDDILAITKRQVADGGTSPGCAIQYAVERKLDIDGIAIVADGNENGLPFFHTAYQRLCKELDKLPPVYVFLLKGDPPNMLDNARLSGVELMVNDLRGGVDYHSLPNLVQTMRTNRYSLVDEINETPLLRLADVFKLAA